MCTCSTHLDVTVNKLDAKSSGHVETELFHLSGRIESSVDVDGFIQTFQTLNLSVGVGKFCWCNYWKFLSELKPICVHLLVYHLV